MFGDVWVDQKWDLTVKNGCFWICASQTAISVLGDRSLSLSFWVFQKYVRDRGIEHVGDRGLSLFLAICGVFEGFRYPEARGDRGWVRGLV